MNGAPLIQKVESRRSYQIKLLTLMNGFAGLNFVRQSKARFVLSGFRKLRRGDSGYETALDLDQRTSRTNPIQARLVTYLR